MSHGFNLSKGGDYYFYNKMGVLQRDALLKIVKTTPHIMEGASVIFEELDRYYVYQDEFYLR